jgi:hypothetical protein
MSASIKQATSQLKGIEKQSKGSGMGMGAAFS